MLGDRYNHRRLTLPPHLVEIAIASSYKKSLLLPEGLKRLVFTPLSKYKLPITLPSSIVDVEFPSSYNHPTILPNGIQQIKVGSGFLQELDFPPSVRKIEWSSNRPVQLNDGVAEVVLHSWFDRPVTFPPTLKKATFYGGNRDDPVTLTR